MRKLLLILSVLFSFVASAQKIQYVNTYGYEYQRFIADTLLGLPKDTFAVPAAYQNIPFIANKSGSIYNWNISTHVWDLFSSGGSYTDADARAAISLTTTGTSGAATYNSSTGVFNIPVYATPTPTLQQVLVAGSTISAYDVVITGGVTDEWTQTMQRLKWEAYSGGGDRGKLILRSNAQMIGYGGVAGADPSYGFKADQSGTPYVDITGPSGEVRMSNLPAGVGTKAVRIDPSTGKLTYADTTTGSITQNWFDDDLTLNGVTTKINRADFFDDMLTTPTSTSGSSYMLEFVSGTGADASIGGTTAAPDGAGWAVMATGTTTTGTATLGSTSVTVAKNIIDTTKTYRFETNVRLESLSDDTEDFRFTAGLAVYTTNTTGNNQIWFRYNDNTNSGNWTCYSGNASVTESTNSGVAATAGTTVRLGFEYDNAQILFYINGSLVATHTTNIPVHGSNGVFPVLAVTKTAGTTNRNIFIDYVKYRRL